MRFIWREYDPNAMPFVEEWLDEKAIQFTGIDNKWQAFHQYWITDGKMNIGIDYWCKVVYDGGTPFAIIAFCLHEGNLHIMELLVRPEMRGRGYGTLLLRELLSNGKLIIDHKIEKATAIVFSNNRASRKTFEKVGFTSDATNGQDDIKYQYFLQQKAESM